MRPPFIASLIVLLVTVAISPLPARQPAKPQVTAASTPTTSTAPDFDFIGEVERGKPFDYDLGQDPTRDSRKKGIPIISRHFDRKLGRELVFHLDPEPEAGAGWTIELLKKGDTSDDRTDFVAVATPPFRSFSERYLSTAFDYTAAAAVALSPRHFYFVESAADYKIADREVDINLYPNHAISDEIDDADDQARKIEVGRGELLILDSRITPATEKDAKGSIDWIKFEVRLTFHTGVTFRRVFVRSQKQQ